MSTFHPSISSPSKFYPTSPPSSATRPFQDPRSSAFSLNGPCPASENNNNTENNNSEEPTLLVPIVNNNNLPALPNPSLYTRRPASKQNQGRIQNGSVPIVPVLPPSLRYYGYRLPAFHFFPLANPYFVSF
uniref:Uncharacterized protein n=1 Tax=Acrobeloides nanus TaxID=290746 RepID=A0A914ED90_9BILA